MVWRCTNSHFDDLFRLTFLVSRIRTSKSHPVWLERLSAGFLRKTLQVSWQSYTTIALIGTFAESQSAAVESVYRVIDRVLR